MRDSVRGAKTLEGLSMGNSSFHRVHPGVKMLCALILIVLTLSFGRSSVAALLPFLLFPSLAIGVMDLPVSLLAKRLVLALPFAAFAGITNVITDRTLVARLAWIPVTSGMVACAGILLRTLLCVSYVLILMAATPFHELTAQLRRFHVPVLFVRVLEMIYRYIGVLADEASGLMSAYQLRAGYGDAGVKLSHAGSFVGGLYLRSADRAERVWAAMQCRGFEALCAPPSVKPATCRDWLFFLGICGAGVLFRAIDIPALISAAVRGIS